MVKCRCIRDYIGFKKDKYYKYYIDYNTVVVFINTSLINRRYSFKMKGCHYFDLYMHDRPFFSEYFITLDEERNLKIKSILNENVM